MQEGRAILYDSMFAPGTYNEYFKNVNYYAQWERKKYFPDQPVKFGVIVVETL